MVEKPKKKGIAIIISVGGKPPKGPADTSTPDMKKYGANPMKKAWSVLKYGGPTGMDGLDDDGNYPQGKTERKKQYPGSNRKYPTLGPQGNYPQGTDPIDMQEYPPGSGRFMSEKDMMEAISFDSQRYDEDANPGVWPFMSSQEMMEARNADARKNLQRMQASKLPLNPIPNPHTDNMQRTNNIMVSPTGNLNDIPEDQRWNPL